MSPGYFSRGALLGVALWSVASNGVRGAEPPPVPEGLEKVRRELEAAKSSGNQPAQPPSGLAAGSFPDWQAAAPTAPARSTPSRVPARETKTNNWLVEAMIRQPAAGKSPDATGATTPERDSSPMSDLAGSGNGKVAEASKSPHDSRIDAKESSSPKLAVPNPFSKYLAVWMSPADLALLRSTAVTELPSRDGFRAPDSGAAVRSDSPPDLSRVIRGEVEAHGGARISGSVLPPRENPYLQALTPISAVPATTKPPQPAKPVGPPIAAGPEVGSVLPSATKGPDFGKPSDNEKYFKQQKRF